MATLLIGKWTMWWNGKRDKASQLPRASSPWLCETERRVTVAGNSMIRTSQLSYIDHAYPALTNLAIEERELTLLDHPGREHAVGLAGGRVNDDRLIGRGAHAAVLFGLTT